jgi:hypothetical protein
VRVALTFAGAAREAGGGGFQHVLSEAHTNPAGHEPSAPQGASRSAAGPPPPASANARRKQARAPLNHVRTAKHALASSPRPSNV